MWNMWFISMCRLTDCCEDTIYFTHAVFSMPVLKFHRLEERWFMKTILTRGDVK